MLRDVEGGVIFSSCDVLVHQEGGGDEVSQIQVFVDTCLSSDSLIMFILNRSLKALSNFFCAVRFSIRVSSNLTTFFGPSDGAWVAKFPDMSQAINVLMQLGEGVGVAGFTAGAYALAREHIIAMKPAPLTVGFLGYPVS